MRSPGAPRNMLPAPCRCLIPAAGSTVGTPRRRRNRSSRQRPELEEPDPELEDDAGARGRSRAREELEDEPPAADPKLPPLYAHGDPDPRPLKGVAGEAPDPGCRARAD